jgi:NifB/MoaA-like Fe-S oxidoreductase
MDRSLEDLSRFSNLISIAGVPVGLTQHGLARQSRQMRLSRTCMRLLPGKQIEVRRHEPEEADEVIAQAEVWQAKFRRERGTTFFYLGDEFYLMTGREVPNSSMYDGFPQIEDGIGITRHFLDTLDTYLRRAKPDALVGARGTIACATLIGPTMREAVGRFNAHTGADLDVAVIENQFFGSEINVSGLLTGGDLIAALSGRLDGQPLYVSSRMVSDRTHTLLDDLTIDQLGQELRVPIVPALTLNDVGRDLRQRLRERKAA